MPQGTNRNHKSATASAGGRLINLYKVTLITMNHKPVWIVPATDENTAIEVAIDATVEASLDAIPNIDQEIEKYPADVYAAAQVCRRDVHDLTCELLATGPLTEAGIARWRKRGILLEQREQHTQFELAESKLTRECKAAMRMKLDGTVN